MTDGRLLRWAKPRPEEDEDEGGAHGIDGGNTGDAIDVAGAGADLASGAADAAGGALEVAGSALEGLGGCADGCGGCSLAILVVLFAAGSAMALFR